MPAENVTETGALFGRLAEDGTVVYATADGAPPPPPPMPEVGMPVVPGAAVPLPPPMPEAGLPVVVGPAVPLPGTGVPVVVEPPAPEVGVAPAPVVPGSGVPAGAAAEPAAGGSVVEAGAGGAGTEAEAGGSGEPPPVMPGDPAVPLGAAVPGKKAGGWEVDPYRLRHFGDAVVRARAYLDAVQAKVDRMQGAELTPQLGTSPVGQQLAKKFDDRLNSADGLRAMLTEAMQRMENFVTSAEKAATTYEELERNAVDTFDNHEYDLEVTPSKKK